MSTKHAGKNCNENYIVGQSLENVDEPKNKSEKSQKSELEAKIEFNGTFEDFQKTVDAKFNELDRKIDVINRNFEIPLKSNQNNENLLETFGLLLKSHAENQGKFMKNIDATFSRAEEKNLETKNQEIEE